MEPRGYALKAVPGYIASRPGIQIGTKLAWDASDEDIRFVQQLGVEWVMTEIRPRRARPPGRELPRRSRARRAARAQGLPPGQPPLSTTWRR